MLFASTGIALPERTPNLQRFLTSARLAEVFNDRRNNEDNLNVGAVNFPFRSCLSRTICHHCALMYFCYHCRLQCAFQTRALTIRSWNFMIKILLLLRRQFSGGSIL